MSEQLSFKFNQEVAEDFIYCCKTINGKKISMCEYTDSSKSGQHFGVNVMLQDEEQSYTAPRGYKVFKQAVNGKEYVMEPDVRDEIYENGMYITSANGKNLQIHMNIDGKAVYIMSLHSFIKEGSKRVGIKDNDTRNLIRSNIK